MQEFQTQTKLSTGGGRNKKHTGSTKFSGTTSPFQTQYSNMTASQTFNHNYHQHHKNNTSSGIRSQALSRKASIQIA